MSGPTSVWAGRSVFVTGHTGFKGSWLSLWLAELDAHVHGYALDPPTNPSLFEVAEVAEVLASDTRGDLNDAARLQGALAAAQPSVVFHLAAQPLVRASYDDPVGTVATNVLGTAQVLDAIRRVPSVRAVIMITTDKVYANREWAYPYRECDTLGGHDLYSASKAASELIVDSFRSSFFASAPEIGQPKVGIASVRAGNVIGGGDWAADRLVPDCLQAFADKRNVSIRNPCSVRPWQHVLEPLSGYLAVAQQLLSNPTGPAAWNFGPGSSGDATVAQVAGKLAVLWARNTEFTPQIQVVPSDTGKHEAGLLSLDVSLARSVLGWQPRWNLDQALDQTVSWQQQWLAGAAMHEVCRKQIAEYGSMNDRSAA